MSILTSEITFDSVFITSYERSGHGSYGSGYCKEQEKYNRKVETVRLFGIKVFKRVIEMELVPSYVWISIGCFGDNSSDWRSKWINEPNFYGKPAKNKLSFAL